MPPSIFHAIVALNALWFGVAFISFWLRPVPSAKLLVPRDAYSSPLFETIAASLRFLGGMNLAMSVFALLLILFEQLFPLPAQRAVFAAVFALGHGSQFAGNVPLALRGTQPVRGSGAWWPVWTGPMRFIFAVDFILMAANLAACILNTRLAAT